MQFKEMGGTWRLEHSVSAMATAATDNEQVFWRAPYSVTLTAVRWVPSAAVTANGTNYSTLSLRNRTTGAGSALPATRSYAATNSVAFVAESMTLSATAADLLVASGDVLTVQMIHTGTGVVIPAGMVQIAFTLR